jgi:hypothetical protein
MTKQKYTYPFPYPSFTSKQPEIINKKNNIFYFPYSENKKFTYPFEIDNLTEKDTNLDLISKCDFCDSCVCLTLDNEPDNYLEYAEKCESAIQYGCPLYFAELNLSKGKNIGFQEVFENENEQILDEIVDNFYKLREEIRPPIKLGHEEEQNLIQKEGYPNAGEIINVKRLNNTKKIIAEFSNVPEEIVTLIEGGQYKRVSSEIYVDYIDSKGESHGPALRAVAILGADIPKIKTLKDLTLIYNSEEEQHYILENSIEKDSNMDKDEIIKQQKIEIQTLQEGQKKTNDEILLFGEQLKTSKGEFDKLSEDLKQSNNKVLVASAALKSMNKEKIEKSLAKSFSPAFIEEVSPHLTYAEDDILLKILTMIQQRMKDRTLEAPEDITMNAEITQPANGDPVTKLHNKILTYSEKNKISYEEAFNLLQAAGDLKV